MANIIEIKVSKISPDPAQPRTFIDQEKVNDMAASMLTEGVIKPIEIDDKNTIITGEMRWRAAIIAGLKTVPCVRRNVSGRSRLRRQLIENLHNHTMSSMDTARAIKSLLPEGDREGAIHSLYKELGCRRDFVAEHLDLLDADQGIKDMVDKKELPRTITRALKMVPDEHRKLFEKKVSKDKMGRDSAILLSRALHFNPHRAEELLKKDYSGKSSFCMAKEMATVAPTLSQRIKQNNDVEKELHKYVRSIIKWLAENNLDDVSPVHRELIKSDFRLLSKKVTKWADEQNLIGGETKKLK